MKDFNQFNEDIDIDTTEEDKEELQDELIEKLNTLLNEFQLKDDYFLNLNKKEILDWASNYVD